MLLIVQKKSYVYAIIYFKVIALEFLINFFNLSKKNSIKLSCGEAAALNYIRTYNYYKNYRQ